MRSGSVPGLNYTKLTLKGTINRFGQVEAGRIYTYMMILGAPWKRSRSAEIFHKTAAGGSMIYRGLVSLSITLTGGWSGQAVLAAQVQPGPHMHPGLPPVLEATVFPQLQRSPHEHLFCSTASIILY
ncbi:hypothetical protein SAY86_001807 [Trapa natans]|uniref:Uncharacterized protein n=1 Tax=Trapa natans TaxID=22666 RepID=A0AAN7R452_TRANT|nr:hypothetical protein SAY86_001807 [Trapa natans]